MIKRKRERKNRKLKFGLLILGVMLAGFFGFFGESTMAADNIYITHNQVDLDPTVTYEMRTSSMQLMMRTDGTAYDDERYKVEWTIEDPTARDIIASIEQGTSKTIGIVKAISPGDVTVTVTVKDSMDGDAVLGSTTCNIRVMFSIDTSIDDSIYKYVNQGDADRSLVMYADDPSTQLQLNFGAANSSNTQWMSSNEEIVKVTQNGGLVTPVGAGKAQVTATYTPTGSSNTYTAYLDVYIIPKVSTTDGGTYEKALDVQMGSGGFLYTDANFSNNLEVIRSKIIWVVKKDDGKGNSTVIADSLGKTSDQITITPTASRTNELKVEGIAGEYDIYFYAYGSYRSETDCTEAYTPTVVHLVLKSAIEDKEEILNIGDSYNFAESFNMTTEDFLASFTVAVKSENGGSAANYVTYNDSTGILKANTEGVVVATLTVRKGKEDFIKGLLGMDKDDILPANFNIKISIVDRIYLDRSNMTISVGQTHQLSVMLTGTYSGTVKWESSNQNFVSVDETGLIKGLKITQEDVTITASLDIGEGITKTATCVVKVEATVEDFTLSPGEDQMMLTGEHLTVLAKIKQTVSVAPLQWISSNEDVFTVETAADGKSAVVTAVDGGNAVLTVINTINNSYQTLNITVRVPIDSISFAKPEISSALYKEGYNMRKEVSYTPKDATDTDLTWSSSDTSVLTIDEDGYVTFKGAGTALISVYPKYNPYNVMASCIFTVIGTPDEIDISETDVTINVDEEKYLEVIFKPENTTTGMTWIPQDDSIVAVDYDDEKRMAKLVGLAPGMTNINIMSSEGKVLSVKVTVKQPSEKVEITDKNVTLRTGESVTLTTKLTPSDSTDALEWMSYDANVAKVDKNGKVTAVKSGTTFIQVTASSGPTSIIQIVVRDGVKGVSLESAQYEVYEEDTVIVEPIFEPATAYDKTMKWSVTDSKVAKVDSSNEIDAEVTGLSAGTTLLTGTTTDGGFTVACLITVKKKPVENDTKVTVSPKTKILALGKSFYVTASVTGSSNKKVKWSTSKSSVCTVSASGKVKAKKVGTAYITATARDGSGAYARCKVKVVRQITKIKLNKSVASVFVGKTLKLKATIKPKKATIKTLKWTSSDNSIATVSSTGRILAVAPGIVKIKAAAKDGSGKSATCIVTVVQPVPATGVSVKNSEITVAKGKHAQSGITVAPANSTTKIKYFSDNKKVATVNKYGKIKTHRAGQATIYGKTTNGKIGQCDVLVVDLNRKEIVMRQYDTEQLRVNLIDEGVTWYSKDINIATVSADGLVTGRRKGVTTVYANVNGVKLGCRVRIKKIK